MREQPSEALARCLSAGLAVLPVRADKVPVLAAWQDLASADWSEVRAMPAGVHWAFHTGKSGLIVVDIDQHGIDGEAAWKMFRDTLGVDEPPPGAIAHTPSGGRHLYYRVPEGAEQMRKKLGMMPGLDIITGQAYVIAWELDRLIPEEIPEAPPALIHLVMPPLLEADKVLADVLSAERLAELTPAERAVYTAHANKEIKRLLDQLSAAKAWPEGHRDPAGRGWEKLCSDVAVLLHNLADAGWSGYSRDELAKLYMDNAPANWEPGPALKWRQQGGRKHPEPIEPPSVLEVLAATGTALPPDKLPQPTAPPVKYKGLGLLEGTVEWTPGAYGFTDRGIATSALLYASRTYRWAEDVGQLLVRKPDMWVPVSGRGGASDAMIGYAVSRLAPGSEDGTQAEQAYHTLAQRLASGSKGSGVYVAAKRVWAEYSSADSVDGSVTEALTTNAADLDTDPEIFWAGGVAWDLRQSYAYPVKAADQPEVNLHSAGHRPPVPGESPNWDRLVETIWPDPEYRDWALTTLSVGLTGYPDETTPFLWGLEGRGKTSILVLLSELLGTYGVVADRRLVTGANAHASIVYALKGARFAWMDETPPDTFTATERLKQLTGGGRLTGNPMQGNPVTFQATHTLALTSNPEPSFADSAMHRRIRPIHCDAPQEAVRAARRACSGAMWRAEQPAVLAKMMAYAARYLDDPSTVHNTAQTLAVLQAAAVQHDPVASWVEDRCEILGDQWTTTGKLWEAYRDWCAANGVEGKERGSSMSFAKRLKEVVRKSTNQPECNWTQRSATERTIRVGVKLPTVAANVSAAAYATGTGVTPVTEA